MRVSNKIRERARALRIDMTPAELKLWAEVRCRQIEGLKFRRQHPISSYIVDFYAPQIKLVVEVDGDSHDEPCAYDKKRTRFLIRKGCQVLRFYNDEIHYDLMGVLERLRDECIRKLKDPHPPSPC
jgi:very-short-patch-repair endonuclease